MTGIRHLHSFVAYLFLLSLLFVVVSAIYNKFKNKPYTEVQWKVTKMVFILSHIQLLLGLGLWMTGGYMTGLLENTSTVMKDSASRLSALEHPMINIIAIALITIGYIKMKKASEALDKNQMTMTFFLGALLLILSRIPWSAWFTI